MELCTPPLPWSKGASTPLSYLCMEVLIYRYLVSEAEQHTWCEQRCVGHAACTSSVYRMGVHVSAMVLTLPLPFTWPAGHQGLQSVAGED